MELIRRWAGATILGLLLTGCIQQEVNIKLNADGSGTLTVRRVLSDMESGISMLGEEVPPAFDTLTVIRHSVEKTTDEPPQKIQIAEYAFTNLAAALPELESLENVLIPRFSIQDDRLVVFMRNEMNPYRGFSSNSATNLFYHLTIDFPTAPQSETGTIEGNRFIWKADNDQIRTFRKSEIGTLAFECSIPADAIALDLQPRTVTYKENKKIGKKDKLVTEMDVRIPIIEKGNRWSTEDANAKLTVCIPVAPEQMPLCYEELKVEKLIIDGQLVIAKLASEPGGVFFGTDQWGRDAPGLPIKIEFGWNSPHLEQIDLIRISAQTAIPTETTFHSLAVDAVHATNAILCIAPEPKPCIAALDISHSGGGQTATLKLATTLKPTDLTEVYLDTTYGLRYPVKGMRWETGKNIRSIERKAAEAIFGKDCDVSVVTLFYPHIPTTSFALTFVKTEELSLQETVLTQENIHVR